MLFSIGNIITILIVLIILALYRQLDRNNRSLDKVRRYSEKITSDIEEFVDHKTQEMKNLAIEIDVHQRTGKEVLKRISNIEEGFSSKASEIDQINSRLHEYEKAINELAGMTGKVDENLKRLHQESEFVDKVGKRLKDAQVRMAQIEKSIPQINEKFAVENEKELEQLRRELFSEVERQSAVVLDGIAQGRDSLDDYTAHIDALEQKREAAAAETMREVSAKLDNLLDGADEKLRDLNDDFSASLDSLLASSEGKRAEFTRQIENSENSFRVHVEEIGDILGNKLVTFKDNINSLEETYQQNLKESAEKAKLLEDDVFMSLKAYIEERSRDTRKQINNVFEELKKNTIVYRSDIDNSFGESQSEITVWRTKLRKELDDGTADISGRLSAMDEEFSSQLASLKPRTEKMLSEIEEESRAMIEGTKGDVFRRVEDMISTVNEKESKLSEFEENLAYKLTRIEELTSDIDLLENNLRQMVDKAVEDVSSGFDDIRTGMEAGWNRSREELHSDVEETRGMMTQLETELESLKSRAYDNVSEKLKDFEDEFFEDLKEKSGMMEKQLKEWQLGIDDRLEALSEESVKSREQLEAGFHQDLNVKIVSLMDKTSGEFSRYEAQVEAYEGKIRKKLDGIDLSVDGMKSRLDSELEEANTELEAYLRSELANTRNSVDSDVTRFIRDSEAVLREAEAAVNAERGKIKQQIEIQAGEIELWQARILQQNSETETSIQEQYSLLKADTAEKMAAVREAMNDQKNDFDALSAEILRRSREIQNELNQQLRGFEEKAGEINENFSLSGKRMYEKIEEQSRELRFKLSEIENKLQGFVAQTKIFERADSMKEALETGISDLQIEITRVTSQASEIRDAEKKFLTIKKLSEDISERVARFNAEKRRIDDLESDFQRLMKISESVEVKLNHVTSADDSLQLVQARLRELDGLQKELDGKYERLQKKESIVDSTIDGVDRGFKQLNELDQMISTVSERSMPLTSRLDELTRRIDFLSKNKSQIDAAISNIETIDTVLSDLEERIEKMQKAREWLAGTETRLEEVNKQAQEQVRLLGTLVKGSESKIRGGGAPTHEIRDVVIKLAHQGWTIEQIAKSTKLARGEVELILELQPKK